VHKVLIIFAACLMLGQQSRPQGEPAGEKPWETKDWRTWSRKDCNKVLTSSPWVSRSLLYQYSRGGFAQIRSAPPIRQAFLRLKQIDKHYDRMNAQQREAFDRQAEAEFAAQFGDNIVVRVTSQWSKDFAIKDRRKKSKITAMLLLPKGRHVLATEFRDDGQNVLAVFPRVLDGEPVIRPGDAIVTFLIGVPDMPAFTANDMPFIFKLDDMIYKGKREF
jgi:hypothetical protein